ncbi:DedA family protein [Roseovarius aestuariivivens]|uniref:DedA family protein n=1 Tax=Roseovarius aestuariivivens TaxID=1888910 RepID=UPI001081F4B5|nr:DedA family protein [Roseovarius aestuariivivens]
MSAWLENIVESYGTLAVFVGTTLEGEAVAIAGGVMAHREHLSFWPVALAAAAGGYLSDVIIYGLGRRYKDSSRVQSVLEHHKVAGIVAKLSLNLVLFALIFRFIPGMRTAGPVALATLGMPPLNYCFLTGAAALVWGVTGVMLGYFMGHTIEVIFGELHRIEHALIGPAIAALVVGIAVYLWRRPRRG